MNAVLAMFNESRNDFFIFYLRLMKVTRNLFSKHLFGLANSVRINTLRKLYGVLDNIQVRVPENFPTFCDCGVAFNLN